MTPSRRRSSAREPPCSRSLRRPRRPASAAGGTSRSAQARLTKLPDQTSPAERTARQSRSPRRPHPRSPGAPAHRGTRRAAARSEFTCARPGGTDSSPSRAGKRSAYRWQTTVPPWIGPRADPRQPEPRVCRVPPRHPPRASSRRGGAGSRAFGAVARILGAADGSGGIGAELWRHVHAGRGKGGRDGGRGLGSGCERKRARPSRSCWHPSSSRVSIKRWLLSA